MAETPPASAGIEIERKYDVGASSTVPDLADVLPGGGVRQQEQELVATYFDTPGLRLRAAKVTLRHRSGDDVAGWHLKTPAGADREEIHARGRLGAAPPAELAALVRSVVRSEPLGPVARLTTRRSVHLLLDAGGVPQVEVVDDHVEGTVLDAGADPGGPRPRGRTRAAAPGTAPEPSARAGSDAPPTLTWREWEAELKAGEPSLLDAVEARLLAAGATPSDAASKVGRVLALRTTMPGGRPWWAADRPSTKRSAGAVVQAHLQEQVDELVRRDPQVRRDVPDSVHKMRVATRRLRSALRTYRPLLDRERTDPLRQELAWLADVLGTVRDTEVMQARILALVEAEPEELVLGPVRQRVEAVLGRRYRAAHTAAVRELDGRRYLRLLDELASTVASPPFDDAARGRAGEVLPKLVRRTWKALDDTMEDASRASGAEQDELLHEARKRAKAARYAAESVQGVFVEAKRFARAMATLQEVLGEHQDGVVTREVLRELGAGASRAGENGFTFGRLHALEQARAEAAVVRWPTVRAEVSDKDLRRWMR